MIVALVQGAIGGITFAFRTMEETSATEVAVAKAFVALREVYELDIMVGELNASHTGVSGGPSSLPRTQQTRYPGFDLRMGVKAQALLHDPQSGRVEPFLTHAFSESFKGVNDLTFDSRGNLYFTDQGQSGIWDPSGRVWRLRASGCSPARRRPTRSAPISSTMARITSISRRARFSIEPP